MQNTDKYSIGADLVAGASIAGLLLPEAVAYSSIGNLPPQAGLIALLAGLLSYALCGRSRYAIVSATSSSAAVLAAATMPLAGNDMVLRSALAIGLTVLTGVFFMLAAAGRFGSLSDFIAKPVLRGFSFGLALVIIIKQLPKVVLVSLQSKSSLGMAAELLARAAEWSGWGLASTGSALALLILLGRMRRLPAALLVIAAGIAASHYLDLPAHGLPLVGTIHLSLQAPSLPRLDYSQWLQLAELALAVLLVLYAESYSSIRGFALRHGDPFEPNRELLALGVANTLSGLLHGMPVGAGYSATAANEAAGARSRLAGLVAALLVLAIVLTLLPLLALTPEPVLAAVVIHAVGHTLNPAIFRPYFQWHRDRSVVLLAIAAVLVLGVLNGLLAGIFVSLVMMLRRLAETRLSVLGRLGNGHDYVSLMRYPTAVTLPGLLILRPETPLFFANVERMLGLLRQHLQASPETHTVILSLEESPDLDGTSLEAIADLAHDIAAGGRRLLLARLKDHARNALLRARLEQLPEAALNFPSVDDAVQAALAQEKV